MWNLYLFLYLPANIFTDKYTFIFSTKKKKVYFYICYITKYFDICFLFGCIFRKRNCESASKHRLPGLLLAPLGPPSTRSTLIPPRPLSTRSKDLRIREEAEAQSLTETPSLLNLIWTLKYCSSTHDVFSRSFLHFFRSPRRRTSSSPSLT